MTRPIFALNENNEYVRVKIDNNKWIKRARYVMEEKLGRKLESREVVHHIDGNTHNDAIEDLQLSTRGAHKDLHKIGYHIDGSPNRKVSSNPNLAWCSDCKEFLPKDRFYNDKRHWNGLSTMCKEHCKERSRHGRLTKWNESCWWGRPQEPQIDTNRRESW